MIAEYQVKGRYFEIREKLTRILIFTTGGISLMLEWRLMVHTKVIHAQYSVCVVDAFKLSLSCWISETWPPLETRLKSAYYCTLWDSRSISHFVVAVVKCAIEQCACEWLGLGLSFFCLWGFKLYFFLSQNRKGMKFSFYPVNELVRAQTFGT